MPAAASFSPEAQRRQLTDGVRLQVDAVAERAQRRHRLVNPAGHADLMQAQRLGQSRDAAAVMMIDLIFRPLLASRRQVADHLQAIDRGLSFNTSFRRPSSLPP